MELRLYWRILKKRLWLVLGLPVVVLLGYWLLAPQPITSYSTSMRFVVGIKPEQSDSYYTYDRYYTWLTAEYLIDDFSEVVKSQVFAQDVAGLSGLPVPAGAIQGATSSGKLHRILTVGITWSDDAELELIAQAVVDVLGESASRYFAQLGTTDAVISLIDPPAIVEIGPSLRQRLDLPLRAILALAGGVALAFLADYLDPSLRDRSDLAQLGLPILAEIPTGRGWFRRIWQRRSML